MLERVSNAGPRSRRTGSSGREAAACFAGAWGQGIQPAQRRLGVTAAGVLAGIQQAIGRDRAAVAGAAQPVAPGHFAGGQVDEIRSALFADDETRREAALVAARMMSGVPDRRRCHSVLGLAGLRVEGPALRPKRSQRHPPSPGPWSGRIPMLLGIGQSVDPLRLAQRPTSRSRNGVSVRSVHPVRPLIHLRRPGLDGLGPLAVLPRTQATPPVASTRTTSRHRHPAQVLGHQQVHQVLGIGQTRGIASERLTDTGP